MNKIEGLKFTLFLLLAVLGAGFVFGAGEARAECPDASFNGGAGAPDCLGVDLSYSATNQIIVTSKYPISHPDYSMENQWAGERNPWNKDYTRIILWELGRADISTSGRGLVWGFISELKAVANGTRSEYESKTHRLFSNPSKYSSRAEWSIFTGEENIVYALNKSSLNVVKINVDTGEESNVTSYDPTGDSKVNWAPDYSYPYTNGWTSDGLLIVNFYKLNQSVGGYLINVKTGSRQVYREYPWENDCSSAFDRFPFRNAIHSDKSMDNKYRIRYSASGSGDNGIYYSDRTDSACDQGTWDTCQVDRSKCPTYVDKNPTSITHVSWHTNNDWFIGANVGSPYIKTVDEPPYLADFKLVQVTFDRVNHIFNHNVLVTMTNAGVRKTSLPDNTDNYEGGIPSPVLRADNSQIMYLGTGGKYSPEDYAYCTRLPDQSICSTVKIDSNRSGFRIYLADLSPASGPQTCTSFTYSAWSECQPNNTQTRTVTSSSPSGCTGGSPVLTQSCDTTPPAPPTGVIVQ